MAQDLKALSKAQMGRLERSGIFMVLAALPQQLADDERVDLLFGAQVDGKTAVLALTDRRLLAAYGMLGRSDSIDYGSIGQVNTGLTKVEIQGAGVKLVAKGVARKDELVRALGERRQSAKGSDAVPAATDNPLALLQELGRLRDAGVLTDEEFAAKKAEVLRRV